MGGEALINNADGYYGGNHNFYIYDTGAEGVRVPPQRHGRDVRLAGQNDLTPSDQHPVFWWERRAKPAPLPGPAGWRR